MDLYDDMQALATDLIGEFGRKTKIKIHHRGGTKNIVSGNFSGDETVDLADGIVLDSTTRIISDVRMVGNGSIMISDKEVLLPASATISDSDKLEFDDHVWAILKFDPCKPGDTVIFNDIWVRR